MKNTFNLNYLAVAFILSSGLAFSAYLLSLTIYRAQVANDTVSVKGLEYIDEWGQPSPPKRLSKLKNTLIGLASNRKKQNNRR